MFTNVLDSIFRMYDSLGELDDKETATEARTLDAICSEPRRSWRRRTQCSRACSRRGAFHGTEHADFVRLVGAQRFLFAEA